MRIFSLHRCLMNAVVCALNKQCICGEGLEVLTGLWMRGRCATPLRQLVDAQAMPQLVERVCANAG